MKKHVLIFAGLFMLSLSALCQNTANLVIFSEDGEPFYAYINGVKQNNKAETNVKVAGISPNISLRIEFENKALPSLKQNMALEPGFEHTARIKKDKNQQLKLRYFGQVPLAESTSADMATVNYHTAEDVAVAGGATQTNSGQGTNNTTTTTRVTQTSSSQPAHVGISMGGVDMNVNVADPNAQTNIQTTTSTTVTQTTSSSGYNTDSRQTTTSRPADPAATGCSSAMNASSFGKMKQSVESKPFSDTRMSTAKLATKNACLSVDQIKEISKLFNMDDDKLTYAKYAYDHCVDKANYYQVSEVFSFSSTTEEFNKFLDK